jgi:hypothetical protein
MYLMYRMSVYSFFMCNLPLVQALRADLGLDERLLQINTNTKYNKMIFCCVSGLNKTKSGMTMLMKNNRSVEFRHRPIKIENQHTKDRMSLLLPVLKLPTRNLLTSGVLQKQRKQIPHSFL